MKFPSREWLYFDLEQGAAKHEQTKREGFGFDALVRLNRLGVALALAVTLLAAGSAAIAQPTVQGTSVTSAADQAVPAAEVESTTPDLPDAPTPVRFQEGGNLQIPPKTFLVPLPAAPTTEIAGLPRFDPDLWSTSTEGSLAPGVEPSVRGSYVPLKDCPTDETRARECRMHWGPMLIESILFNAFEDAGNLYTGYWYRWETLNGKWWDRYIDSAAQWRWDHWSDDNPFLDDYVAHPFMGAITNSIWIQNDPKGMTLGFQNDREYWKSRLTGARVVNVLQFCVETWSVRRSQHRPQRRSLFL